MLQQQEEPDTDVLPLTEKHVVVCVDDEPPTLAALARVLKEEPYEFRTTTDPRQALDWLGTLEVSLVLSDHRMPQMTGVELLEAIRQLSPGTTCVILTGYRDSAMSHPDARRLVRDLIEKPWDDRSLKRTVRNLLRERELRRRKC